jgi:hypothetical protein
MNELKFYILASKRWQYGQKGNAENVVIKRS